MHIMSRVGEATLTSAFPDVSIFKLKPRVLLEHRLCPLTVKDLGGRLPGFEGHDSGCTDTQNRKMLCWGRLVPEPRCPWASLGVPQELQERGDSHLPDSLPGVASLSKKCALVKGERCLSPVSRAAPDMVPGTGGVRCSENRPLNE